MPNNFLAPQPIEKPIVDPHLEKLAALARSTECFRYSFLSVEFWISPEGRLREWLRKNVRWSAVLMVPAVTVFPLITLVLWELEAWVNALTTIASKLVFLPILALLAVISISIVFRVVRAFKP